MTDSVVVEPSDLQATPRVGDKVCDFKLRGSCFRLHLKKEGNLKIFKTLVITTCL